MPGFNSLNFSLEDARYRDNEDEREEIVTYVSTCGLQRKSNKDKIEFI